MKASYLWLKEFVDISQTPEELAKTLRGLGFDVATIERAGGAVTGVVTAKVESVAKHPNADKLKLCKVFDGKTRWDVVCGAPNVAEGQTVPMAQVGAKLPGGQTIEKAVIRGQESSGMLCSGRELGLGDDHSGILVLPEGTPLGEDVTKALSLGDAILDVEVTPNRPDALSHWGLAREIAAATGKKLRLPNTALPKTTKSSALVKNAEPKLCSRYIARAIDGVSVKPSPLWMKLRLERCGIRSISNVVDVTNYVLLELGHPLHAFDRDRLGGNSVVVRRAADGEKLDCLDEVERSVAGHLVIADAARPAAVAGIIGGRPSAVIAETQNLLLESAVFLPGAVRRARVALGVSTESSYRFERGTDFDVADLASRRAAKLILELAGGTLAAEQDAAGKRPAAGKISTTASRINGLLGTRLAVKDIKTALDRLGFKTAAAGDKITAQAPGHRADVRDTADVAEEVARMAGYDRIPSRIRGASQALEDVSAETALARAARAYWTGLGFFEACNYGLVSRALWEKWAGTSEGAVELANPISLSGELLAPSLLPRLLENVQLNLRQGNANVRLFESAKIFRQSEKGVEEIRSLAWVACGEHPFHWKHKPRALDIWDVKAWVKTLLLEWRLADVRFEAKDPPAFLHPSESQAILLGGEKAGFFGRIHPRRAKEWEVPEDTFLGGLNLTALAGAKRLEPHFAGLAKQPPVMRDFSLVFPETVGWSAIAHHLFREYEHIDSLSLFDVFKDDTLPPQHRSLAFRISFRRPDRTMTDAEVGQIQTRIIDDFQRTFRAAPRGAPAKPSAIETGGAGEPV